MKTMQEIEDFYVNQGYREDKLREILSKDKEYQKILNERKNKLTNKFRITDKERKEYVLSTDSDFDILAKCKELEKKNLSTEHREIIKLIKTQLEDDWRKPLTDYLNKLMKIYQ